jgi:hypothetical protein
MSVTKVPTKQAMGNGTSIGWIGCAAICAVERKFGLSLKGGLLKRGLRIFRLHNQRATPVFPS